MNPENIRELIQRRRLQILVHSCVYYVWNQNVISDKQWDEWARELAGLQEQYPEISEDVPNFLEAFRGFDGTTGFDLPIKDKWVMQKAQYVMRLCGVSNKERLAKKKGRLF